MPPGGSAEPVRVLTEERGATRAAAPDALALDALELLESAWRGVAPVLGRHLPSSDINTIAPEELSFPGIQEYWLNPGRRALTQAGGTSSSSTAPHRRRAADAHVARGVRRLRRTRMATPPKAVLEDPRTAAAALMIEALHAGVERLLAAADPRAGGCSTCWCSRPGTGGGRRRAARTLTALAVMGIRVNELIEFSSRTIRASTGNLRPGLRVVRGADRRAAVGARRAQRHHWRPERCSHLAGEPVGPKALGQLLDEARRRDGSAPPGRLRLSSSVKSGSGLDAVLPHAARVAPASTRAR